MHFLRQLRYASFVILLLSILSSSSATENDQGIILEPIYQTTSPTPDIESPESYAASSHNVCDPLLSPTPKKPRATKAQWISYSLLCATNIALNVYLTHQTIQTYKRGYNVNATGHWRLDHFCTQCAEIIKCPSPENKCYISAISQYHEGTTTSCPSVISEGIGLVQQMEDNHTLHTFIFPSTPVTEEYIAYESYKIGGLWLPEKCNRTVQALDATKLYPFYSGFLNFGTMIFFGILYGIFNA